MLPDAIADQLRALGLPSGAVAVVHISFRAVGPVDGGPTGLISALRRVLGPDGTLVMPSMSDDDDHPFDRTSTPCRGMGIVAETFWRRPNVLRSDHVAAFAAEGPLARAITAPHPLAPPHGIESPVGRACALGGFVLLLGVGHDANTTLHLAESLAQVPYRARKYCTVVRDGLPVRVEYDETDHCCIEFSRADGWLRERKLQVEGPVGRGVARLARATDIVRVAVEELGRDPFAFLHARGEGCKECDAAWASVA
jgi:aminoglycoside N3'-acetyltransferase